MHIFKFQYDPAGTPDGPASKFNLDRIYLLSTDGLA